MIKFVENEGTYIHTHTKPMNLNVIFLPSNRTWFFSIWSLGFQPLIFGEGWTTNKKKSELL